MNWGYNPPRDAGKKKKREPPKHLSKLKKNTTYTRASPKKQQQIPKNPSRSTKIPQDPSKSPKIPQFTMVFWCLPHQVTLIEVLNPVPSAVVVGSTGSSSSMKRSTYCRRAAASCGRGEAPKRKVKRGGKMEKSPGKTEKTMENPRKFTRKNWKNQENLLISWGTIWRESIEGCGFQKRWIRCWKRTENGTETNKSWVLCHSILQWIQLPYPYLRGTSQES